MTNPYLAFVRTTEDHVQRVLGMMAVCWSWNLAVGHEQSSGTQSAKYHKDSFQVQSEHIP
jgi:hypothetical protein